MAHRTWWVTLAAVWVLAGPATAVAGPQAKAKEQPVPSKKEIPVAPETRLKIHAVFAKHAQGPLDRMEETRSGIYVTLMKDDLATAQCLQPELQRRAAEPGYPEGLRDP